MKIVILSKALLSVAYRRKTDALAAIPGVQLTVCVPPEWREPRAHVVQYEPQEPANYQIEVLPMQFNGQHHLHWYPTFARVIRRIRPDIVHIDEESFNFATFMAMRAARQVGAKSCFYNYANIERTYPPPFAWFERYAFTHADYALACSHEAADIITRHGYRGPLRIIAQTGVDPDVYSPRPDAHLARSPFTIGYVGRLVGEKGLDDMIAALALLPESMRLHVVGAGAHAEALKAHAAQRGVAHRITWQAPVSSNQVADVMRTFDALVLPSRTTANWKEQFGRVIIEAMACGVPVVGSDSGEIPHVIGDGGRVFAEQDPQALAQTLLELSSAPSTYAQYSKQARQRVLNHYTQQALAQQYYSMYQEMYANTK